MKMKTKSLNHSSLWEHLIWLFTCFNEEDNLSQEADVAGMVRIRHSNLTTSARAWFSSSSCIIAVTSWMLDAFLAKFDAWNYFSLHFNPSKSNMFLYTSKIKNAFLGNFIFVSVKKPTLYLIIQQIWTLPLWSITSCKMFFKTE